MFFVRTSGDDSPDCTDVYEDYAMADKAYMDAILDAAIKNRRSARRITVVLGTHDDDGHEQIIKSY